LFRHSSRRGRDPRRGLAKQAVFRAGSLTVSEFDALTARKPRLNDFVWRNHKRLHKLGIPFDRSSELFMRIRLALILALAATGLQAQGFSSLEERMSASEFKAAGLEKLSPEELAALNDWLRQRGAATAAMAAAARVPRGDERVGFADGPSSRSVVSRIDGEFTGWSGSTRFVLENGQVWQQAEATSLTGVKAERPAVTIEPAFLGSWRMRVDGFNQRVRVKRIE
jgi:hypothetical protein